MQHRGAILAIILVSHFMTILDNSIILTGLSSTQTSMQFTSTGLTWVQDAYTLVFGGLLLLGARAGDIGTTSQRQPAVKNGESSATAGAHGVT